MIEHESDLWPERYWAIDIARERIRAYPFPSLDARGLWIIINSASRSMVGKRHPAVKALRQRWRQEALKRLAERKER